MRGLVLALAALIALGSGCGSEDAAVAPGPGGGTGGVGGAGSGGTPAGTGGAGGTPAGTGGIEAPCLDIWVHPWMLPPPLDLGYSMRLPRKPFWRDERGLHVAYARPESTNGIWQPVHLVVSTFDPATGEALAHRVYDPFPPHVIMGGMTVFDAAGAPDGSFAVGIGYGDDDAPYGYVEKIVLGHLDESALVATWVAPWSSLDWFIIHVGWDGEAFAIDFKANYQRDVLLVRLAADGSEVLAPTEVGATSSSDPDKTSFRTDPETGTTWLVSSFEDGVRLSGHLRDGSPLPGTGALEYVVISGQGVPPALPSGTDPAVAPDGERALLAWGDDGHEAAYLQLVEAGQEVGEATVLLDGKSGPGPWMRRRHLARLDDGWWLAGGLVSLDLAEWGIQSYWFADSAPGGIELVGRTPIVGAPPCWPGCELDWQKGFDVRQLAALRWQDELWFGFRDQTEHTDNPIPYRIVRVGRSCRYPTLFEIYHPELMPAED